ncbi:glycosyl hydrolase family 18 protein [Halobiforma nitratireducens]|uniref:Glycoside hydrolase family protein n=1 Tax=Halobiforma nitratireducens JCM 10879 TaxID=1227454 RepID=M0MPD1_9EURY|nr:glycosyl hydrolase family 18 protein [Halobiforma nitratireducens]EMA46579.1 glycoside hydrolase family protein [Halobiforma nitratireducens JCM 10879]
MKRTRRNVLSNATKLSALLAGIGASGAVAAEGNEYPEWDPETVYTSGDRVIYEGYVWEAQWWTRGNEPGEGGEWGPWEEIEEHDDDDDEDEDEDEDELTARFTVSDQFPAPGEEIEFDASDSEGEIDSYEWEFEDGTTASGDVVTRSFDEGQYDVTLTVEGADGETDTDSIRITAGRPSSDEKRVVAYYRQWAQYDRDYVPADIPYDQVTHVQYAFARPESDGSVTLVGDSHGQQAFWGEEDWQGVEGGTFAEFAEERDDTKFVLSIGGWGDSRYFSDAALTQESREQFAEDCIEWIERGNLDGIDIDWEFPGGGGCTSEDADEPASVCPSDGNIVREGDQERFTLLCETVRERLDEHAQEVGRDEPYELTAAVSANPEVVEGIEDGNDGLEHERLSEVLDFVLVMTFDYAGVWSETTRHHAPLKANPDDPFDDADSWNAEYALQYWEQQGWDPDQINMAVPFYGRSWDGVQPPEDAVGTGEDDGLFQAFEGDGSDASMDGSYPSPPGQPGSQLGGVFEWFDLEGDGRGGSNSVDLESDDWEVYFDEDAVAAWAWNSDSREMISYESQESMEAKMQWLRDSPYGGTMLWAIGGDTYEEELIDTLWTNLNG